MPRPIGSKNKVVRPVRVQYQLRLLPEERAEQEEVAARLGLTWSDWARMVLIQAVKTAAKQENA